MLKMSIKKIQANKLFIIQLLDPFEKGEWGEDNFQNAIYRIKSKLMHGSEGILVSGKNNEYEVKIGQEFIWEISKALYNNMSDIEGEAKVGVTMAVSGKTTTWLVSDMDDDTKIPDLKMPNSDSNNNQGINYGYKDVADRDDKRSLDIKWGMSLNNAVKIICQSKDSKFFEDIEQVQVEVRNLTHRMMNVATGLNIWLKEKQDEKSFQHSIDDEKF